MNILKNIIIDTEATIGNKLLLLEVRSTYSYNEGIKGQQEGVTFNVLSEKLGYEKVDIKITGILEPPFEFNGTPVPVEFEGLEAKLWQDWNNKGAVKLSVTAKAIKLHNASQKMKLNLGGDK